MVTCWITRPNSCPTSKIMTLLDSHNISKTPEFSVECESLSMCLSQFQRDTRYQWRHISDQSTYFAREPNCFRMLRDCRSMLAVKSNQLFYLTFSVRLSLTRYPASQKKRRPHHAGSCCVTSSGTEASLCGVFLRVRVWAVSFCSCFKSALLSHISHKLVSEEVAQMKCQPWGGGFFSSA